MTLDLSALPEPMNDVHALPPDLTPEETRAVEAFRSEAVREAEEDAALFVRVNRAYRALRSQGHGKEAAFQLLPERVPVSEGTARRMVYRQGRWGVPG